MTSLMTTISRIHHDGVCFPAEKTGDRTVYGADDHDDDGGNDTNQEGNPAAGHAADHQIPAQPVCTKWMLQAGPEILIPVHLLVIGIG